jgi:hypothetical protein
MRLFSATVFDDLIAGTALVWYTSSEAIDLLAQADVMSLHVCPRGVSGNSPTLSVNVEHSADAQLWATAQALVVNSSLQNETTLYASTSTTATLLSFVRFRISLGGTSPKCFLKVYVTGRARAA